jgi:hypothetical protein
MNNLRLETTQFRAELHAHNAYHSTTAGAPHPQQAPQHNTAMNGYGNAHFERPSTQPDPRQQHQVPIYNQRPTELPPLRGISGPAPEAMSGVQYQQHDPRPNGYRAGAERF